MQHVLIAVSITLLVGGCAVVDRPTENAGNPDWVEDRLDQAGDGRQAPAVVPVTSIPAAQTSAMDAEARRLLAARAAMAAEAERREAENRRGSPEEFTSEGQARTQPPQQ
ncbi:hypothetical protein AWH62_04975 [Maricaulis sp. W15]|uniref:hypothetical protein n=1 Tax=Maricaulis sp. W15 TaxID=1772333 RepID=UPI0009488B1E|nr:hypothetical protein [Maricaulis sp. W15]OLF78015.1 hypothetical protein AWH62_04975 [Maricaulis sp. W15]